MKTETLEPTTSLAEVSTGPATAEPIPHVIHVSNILVPLDFSDSSLKALQYAVPFARQFNAKLTLLHVLAPPIGPADFPYPGSVGRDSCGLLEKRLEEIRATLIPAEIPVDTILRQDFVFDGVLATAREIRADLIITATHGYSGLKHLLMGSTAENIVRRAPCPVLVVREHDYDFV